ncbi:MAG TPA: hypothetical protein VFJ77_00675 [Gaiellaceae bacterium]|nr:hypothetical protein [Gaiellaceae bacterium]
MRQTTRQRETTRGIRLVAVVAALGLGLLAFGAAGASAKERSLTSATNTCWKDVVNDWLQHQPNVLGTYDPACYSQAIQHLAEYPDIQQYSNAPDDIHRAYLAALRDGRGGGPGSGSDLGGGGPAGPGGGDGDGPGGGSAASQQPPDKGVVTKLFDAVGPGDAQSIPLPLLVLAGLAVLLLLAAGGTWLAKRIQARRMTPAPAPAGSRRR